MNIKSQVAILVLLHIIPLAIPLELQYGHYIVDQLVSRPSISEPLASDLRSLIYRDFARALCVEMLIIIFSLCIPKSTRIYKFVFKQFDHTTPHDKTPINQEKAKTKPIIHWPSSVFPILISLNIVHSFFLISKIYNCIIVLYYLIPLGCCDPTIPFLNTFVFHTLLLSYTSILIGICYNIRKQFFHSLIVIGNFYFLFVISDYRFYWNRFIEPTLSYIKNILFSV